MKRYYILTVVGLFIGSICCHAADASQGAANIPKIWTAEQAVAYAIADNPDSTIAHKRIEQAMAAATMAKAVDYPLVNVSTEYGQTNNPMYSFGTILNQGAFNNNIDFNDPGRTDNLQVKAQVKLQKSLCRNAPFYVLGPLVTDIAPGYDHITGAIGGAIAALLGLIGIVAWFPQFLTVIAGTIPVMLLLGGALAIYLGIDELKDTWNQEEGAEPDAAMDEDVEKYKQEISQLKEEIETLKEK